MSFETRYSETAPSRDEVSGIAGPVLLEFGTDWCGHCRAAQPLIAAAMAGHPSVRHLKIHRVTRQQRDQLTALDRLLHHPRWQQRDAHAGHHRVQRQRGVVGLHRHRHPLVDPP